MAPSYCEAPECLREAHARGLCSMHYQWLAKHGGLEAFERVHHFKRKHRPIAGRLCEVDGCEKPVVGGRYCSMHSERVRLTGKPGPAASKKRPANQPCEIEGCALLATSRGLCYRHRYRMNKYGAPGPVGRMRRERGTGAIEQGYKTFKVGDRRKSEHRQVWEAANGPVPKGHVIHHRNQNKLDNRLENLELMTRAQHRHHHHDDLLAGKQKV